jgi:site-specific DNA recombinase
LREKGQTHFGGPRRFGWPGLEPVGKGTGPDGERLPVPAELVERERQAIRDAAGALLAGVTQGQLVREWNAGVLLTADSREWVTASFKAMMLRATNAGLVEYDSKLIARMDGDPILDEATFGRLRAMFAGRRRGRIVGEKYIGTGILRCGNCSTKLSASKKNSTYRDGGRRAVYFCNKERRGCGRVYADVRAVDAELRTSTVVRLSDPRHAAAIAEAREHVADQLTRVETEIRQCEEYQRALADRLGRREITLDAFDAANVHLVEDLARLRVERDSLPGVTPGEPQGVLSVKELAQQWDSTDNAGRRGMLTRALGYRWMVIDPRGRGTSRVFDPTRMHLVDPDTVKGQSSLVATLVQ